MDKIEMQKVTDDLLSALPRKVISSHDLADVAAHFSSIVMAKIAIGLEAEGRDVSDVGASFKDNFDHLFCRRCKVAVGGSG